MKPALAFAALLLPLAAAAQAETVLHRFPPTGKATPGPQKLVELGGALYGATASGGNKTAPNCPAQGCGTIYRLSVKGDFKPLYAFAGGADGAAPIGPMVSMLGVLYGVTQSGGGATACTGGCGTIFSISPSGQEHVLYAFPGGAAGAQPNSLTVVGGKLEGTTYSGGDATCNCGIEFELPLGGSPTIRHAFVGGTTDGAFPSSAPVAIGTTLYGSTLAGGAPGQVAPCPTTPAPGCGVVYALQADNRESLLHLFRDRRDGSRPNGLMDFGGTLVGVTQQGDTATHGRVFSLSTQGQLTSLHVFYPPGWVDPTSLVLLNGAIYGIAQGGPTTCHCGNVFTLGSGSSFATVYRFRGGLNGADPASLVAYNNLLFATTNAGGSPAYCGKLGCGTVVELAP